jgi:hypothetical protein
MIQNKYPIFIPSKGRWESRYTAKALKAMGVSYRLVIEDQEYDDYAKVEDKKNLLILDKSYQKNYEVCDNLALTKSVGPGAARNFIWDYSISEGYAWHWVMDDNIMHFCRLNRNQKLNCYTPAFFRAMEDFCERYENIAMAGPAYTFFCATGSYYPPFIINTRIYSCNFIRNDVKQRWRGRYNEDTILSLDMMKAGWCTLQFNAFLQDKAATQTVKGGNDKDFYSVEGTLPKSEMLVKVHPDCSKLLYRFHRWHHYVDYDRFKDNKLIKKSNIIIPNAINNYNMKLINLSTKEEIKF